MDRKTLLAAHFPDDSGQVFTKQSTVTDGDESVHLVHITFHPDGTYTVVDEAGPDEGATGSDSAAHASAAAAGTQSTAPPSSAAKQRPSSSASASQFGTDAMDIELSADRLEHRHIAVNGQNRSRSLAYFDHVRACLQFETKFKRIFKI